MTHNMRTRLIAGAVLIVVGVAGLVFVGGKARAYQDGEGWGGPMMQGPMMSGPMTGRPGMRRHMMDGFGGRGQFGPRGGPGARDRGLPPIAGARVVEIAATDTACTPSDIPVKAGEAVNVTLANRGTTARYLVIPGDRIRLVVPPGQTATTGFTAAAAGDHEFYCGVPGRREGRTVGRISVGP